MKWTAAAVGDLKRLFDFLHSVSPTAAKATAERLKLAPARLQMQPRMGKPLPEFEPREVRRIIVGDYELRYEFAKDLIYVLRIWHTRESR